MTKEDAAFVRKFLKENQLEGWNSRLEKRQGGTETIYIIRLASIPQSKKNVKAKLSLEQNEILKKEFEGATFIVKNGDYGAILEKVVAELAKAKV